MTATTPIFDCDGTLIDSERLYNRAWSTVLPHFGAGRLFVAAMVKHGKPAPDLFLRAAERMGVTQGLRGDRGFGPGLSPVHAPLECVRWPMSAPTMTAMR